MELFHLIFNNSCIIFLFIIFFGGSIGTGIKWIVERSFAYQEKMQELKNEGLRLQLQILQENKKSAPQDLSYFPTSVTPKDASWEEREYPDYEPGYPQQQQQQIQ